MTVFDAPKADPPAAARQDASGDHGTSSGRRYDLDWLRIGAFCILILYHVGLVYTTWDIAHVRSRYSSTLIEPAMALISSLAALFFISGVAVRFTIDKTPWASFVMERSRRLLIPLAFGMLVLGVPQSYVALRFSGDIEPGYFTFWRDYLGFGKYAFSMPDVNHLWYVVAIFSYTIVVALCLPLLRMASRSLADPFFAWLAKGSMLRTLFVPAIPFVLYVAILGIYLSSTEWSGWAGTARTLSYFLLGFLAAKSDNFWKAIDRALPGATVMALFWGALLATAWIYQFDIAGDENLLYAALLLRPFYSWSLLVMALGLARKFANRKSRALAYLTTGIFPYYILHQTIIVVVAYWFTLYEVPLGVEATTIVVAAFAGSAIGYEIVRRVNLLRPLFGLPMLKRETPGPAVPAERKAA